MSTLSKSFLTPEQYLEIERKADYKSEYYQGEMFAMSGAQMPHILLTANMVRELGQQLRRTSGRVCANDLRVCMKPSGLYTYPDLVVICGKPEFLDSGFDTVLNPTLIVEVLSDSTEAYDRGRKFELYRGLESMMEYLLISSRRVSAESFTRQPDGRWLLTASSNLEDAIELTSVNCSLRLADLYENVDFNPRLP